MSNANPTFIKALRAVNRKERFYVVGFALGAAGALLVCAGGNGAAAVIADSPFADLE